MGQKKMNLNELRKMKVAVLYGGHSKESSYVSGKEVYSSLKHQGFNVILVDPKYDNIYKNLINVDVAFLALFGRYGEDGKIQGFLEILKIPYTGSGVLASALGMDKFFFKKIISLHNIPTPEYEIFNVKNNLVEEAKRIINILNLPLFLKPISEGGSLGSAIIHTEADLTEIVKENLQKGFDKFIVEKYIAGRAMTVGLIQRKGTIKCLPILEVVTKNEFYDFEAKFNHRLHTYYCPANLPNPVYRIMQYLAKKVHIILGCHGYSRVDFILDKKNNPYILELNTLPGLSLGGNMVTMALAAKITFDELIIEILKSALTKNKYLP